MFIYCSSQLETVIFYRQTKGYMYVLKRWIYSRTISNSPVCWICPVAIINMSLCFWRYDGACSSWIPHTLCSKSWFVSEVTALHKCSLHLIFRGGFWMGWGNVTSIAVLCYWTALKSIIHYNHNLLCDYSLGELMLLTDQRTWMHNTEAVDNWQEHQVAEYLMMLSHSLPYITVVIRWRTMRREWNTTCTEERGNPYRPVLGNSEGKGHLEDLGLGGNMILKWVL